jgi:cysteine synthase B
VLASVQPDSPLHGLEGLKHMETAIVPGIYDPELADEDLRVSTEDAHAMTRRLAREEGLLVGISSGANLAGALQLIAAEDRSSPSEPSVPPRSAPRVVVMIFPDGGERYLSERFWSEAD